MSTPPGGWADAEDHVPGPTPVEVPNPGAAEQTPTPVPGPRSHGRRPRAAQVASILLTVLLAATAGLAWYLHDTARAWEQRSEEYLEVSLDLGEELAGVRRDLAGAQAELDAVRAQLGTLQTRLVELANEKARLGDDWEIQLQHLDYQERVTEAAGEVALALDQCVRGQNDLIGYLRNAEEYDEEELDLFAEGVQELCDRATEANISLQLELSR